MIKDRIVLLAPNWLGDAVLSLPVVGAVRRAFPGAHLAVAARPSIAALYRLPPPHNSVDEVVTLEGGWRRDTQSLGAGAFDRAILLPNAFRAAWIAWRAGIRERWGYAADGRRWLLTRAVRRPRGSRHQSEYYGALAAGLDLPAGGDAPALEAPPDRRARARELLVGLGWREGPLVGIAPGTAYGGAKQWPATRFAELIDRLSVEGVATVLVGTPADRQTGIQIEEKSRGASISDSPSRPEAPAAAPSAKARGASERGWGQASIEVKSGSRVNVIGQTDLPMLAGVISHCDAFVSNDSGAMHLAAALGVPVTAIFGPTRERETAPLARTGAPPHAVLTHEVWCRPCMLRECPIDHRCMTRIPVGRVLAACLAPLHASRRLP